MESRWYCHGRTGCYIVKRNGATIFLSVYLPALYMYIYTYIYIVNFYHYLTCSIAWRASTIYFPYSLLSVIQPSVADPSSKNHMYP